MNLVHVISATKTSRGSSISPDTLARLWHCGLTTAMWTLASTTQDTIYTANTIHRRFRTDLAYKRYRKLATYYGDFYVDAL